MMERSEKVFVTGASGFLGQQVIRVLLSSGYMVRGLVRNRDRYRAPFHHNLELVEADLRDDLTPYVTGIDHVIHVAALIDPAITDEKVFWEINFRCTVSLADAAMKASVRRFVFISTTNTIGFGSQDHPGNENRPMCFPFTRDAYALSKFHAERDLMHMCGDIELIILHPGFMIGSSAPQRGSGRIWQWSVGKKLIWYPPGGRNFVSVFDVANGVLQAMQKGCPGERYLIVNENLTYRQLFEKIRKFTGKRSILLPVPTPALWVIGIMGDVLRWIGISTPLSSNHMRILSIRSFYDNSKSKTKLDIEYESLDTSILKALRELTKEVRLDVHSP